MRRHDRILVVVPTFVADGPENALRYKRQLKGWTPGRVWRDDHWIVVEALRPAGD